LGLKISFSKIGLGIDIKLGWLQTGCYLRQFSSGVVDALGLRNNTFDAKRVLFFDYDQILYDEMLLPEIRYLQDKYGLGTFYIYRSSQKEHSYHAVCFDKVKVYEWKTILDDSSCDEAYKKPALKDFKTCVLRVSTKGKSQKPRYLTQITPLIPTNRESSLAHANFFKFHYDTPIDLTIGKWDNSDKLIFVKYGTLNYLSKKDGVK
jgi:hypothetical protein